MPHHRQTESRPLLKLGSGSFDHPFETPCLVAPIECEQHSIYIIIPHLMAILLIEYGCGCGRNWCDLSKVLSPLSWPKAFAIYLIWPTGQCKFSPGIIIYEIMWFNKRRRPWPGGFIAKWDFSWDPIPGCICRIDIVEKSQTVLIL